jgi:hypothetical protein
MSLFSWEWLRFLKYEVSMGLYCFRMTMGSIFRRPVLWGVSSLVWVLGRLVAVDRSFCDLAKFLLLSEMTF